ncbi:MAG: hypothetical protein J6K53_02750 [Roseburia sp.]|nr:hypothetical protein [Roseburia sp.]
MSNFERIKQCKDEYEMTDLICGYISNNLQKMKKKNDPCFNSQPFLEWLKSNRNIFDEESTSQ